MIVGFGYFKNKSSRTSSTHSLYTMKLFYQHECGAKKNTNEDNIFYHTIKYYIIFRKKNSNLQCMFVTLLQVKSVQENHKNYKTGINNVIESNGFGFSITVHMHGITIKCRTITLYTYVIRFVSSKNTYNLFSIIIMGHLYLTITCH